MTIALAGLSVLVLVAVVAALVLVPTDKRPATEPRPTIGYIGDSLTVGGMSEGLQPAIEELGYDASSLRIDGLIGRSIVDGVPPYVPSSQDVVTTWRQDGFHPNVWLIALVSNDFGKSKDELKLSMNKLIDVIDDEPVRTVLWVGPIVKPGSELQSQVDDTMYPALSEVMSERAGSIDIKLLNLQAAIRDRQLAEEVRVLWTDDRHMTAEGYRLRNQLIVEFCRTQL